VESDDSSREPRITGLDEAGFHEKIRENFGHGKSLDGLREIPVGFLS
jgi:hypothetical protein